MLRREFIAGLGSAAAWPLAARAQQPVSLIGYLSSRSSESDASMLVALRRGLNETGFVEGQNLAIEYRFADAQYGRLPDLVAELVLRRIAVIVFAGARGTIDDPVWRQLRTCRGARAGRQWVKSRLTHCKKGRRKLAPRRDATRSHATLTAIRCPHSGLEA